MNNEFNMNTRTLIVCFIFALMVMVPLRFVEVGNYAAVDSTVLGDSTEFADAKLESPYDVLESQNDCLSDEYVDKVISFLDNEDEIADFQSRRCN